MNQKCVPYTDFNLCVHLASTGEISTQYYWQHPFPTNPRCLKTITHIPLVLFYQNRMSMQRDHTVNSYMMSTSDSTLTG